MNEDNIAAQPLEEAQLPPGQACEDASASPAAGGGEPQEASETSPEGSNLGWEPDSPVTQPGGEGSAPPVSLTPEEKAERDLAMFEKQEFTLLQDLEAADRAIVQAEERKARAVKSMNDEIKGLEADRNKVLQSLEHLRIDYDTQHAPPPDGVLPFGGSKAGPEKPAEKVGCANCGHAASAHFNAEGIPRSCNVQESEDEHGPINCGCNEWREIGAEVDAEPEEPWVEDCQACGGSGIIVDDECEACSGTGKVVPQPEKEGPSDEA